MEGEAWVLQDRIEIAALERRVGNAQERIEVVRMKSWKAAAIQACTASALALSFAGNCRRRPRPVAPNKARIIPTASWSLRGFPRCW